MLAGLTGPFFHTGKLTDAIGRKPVLILAPALAVVARATVVAWPVLPVLLGARFCTTFVSLFKAPLRKSHPPVSLL